VSAGKWVPLTGYTLSEVYNTESSKRWLYRCIDDFDAVVKPTGQACFYLSDKPGNRS
jgi:hypothetical protein